MSPLIPVKEVHMRRSFLFGFLAGLVLLIVAGVGASRLRQKDKEEAAYLRELVDATPVQLGVLTEQQRVHSKLAIYARYEIALTGLKGGKKISEAVTNLKGKVYELCISPGLTELPSAETPSSFFGELASKSDSVIRGMTRRKVSQITDNDSFVFTDYYVVVTEVLKDDSAAPLHPQEVIVVTRPGGKVLVEGAVIRATDEGIPPLPLGDHDLLLFLRRVPETGAYTATRYDGTFEVDGPIVKALTGYPLPPGILGDSRSFIHTLRDATKQ
jgi:hypothetical protein